MEHLPSDYFVTVNQFVKTVYRTFCPPREVDPMKCEPSISIKERSNTMLLGDVYPSIDPSSATNSQAGKVIVIVGASKGIGREVSTWRCQSFAK
jgi:hypothetical protein